jgi:hypothetical protein
VGRMWPRGRARRGGEEAAGSSSPRWAGGRGGELAEVGRRPLGVDPAREGWGSSAAVSRRRSGGRRPRIDGEDDGWWRSGRAEDGRRRKLHRGRSRGGRQRKLHLLRRQVSQRAATNVLLLRLRRIVPRRAPPGGQAAAGERLPTSDEQRAPGELRPGRPSRWQASGGTPLTSSAQGGSAPPSAAWIEEACGSRRERGEAAGLQISPSPPGMREWGGLAAFCSRLCGNRWSRSVAPGSVNAGCSMGCRDCWRQSYIHSF